MVNMMEKELIMKKMELIMRDIFTLVKSMVMESYIIQIIHGKKMFILKMEKK
jgi:hypothetical protein